ncbi:MAG: dTMP kinase [Vicinamibacterales bacterium]
MSVASGHLIAFEGLDQSGKQTQAEWLAAALRDAGYLVQTLSFPDYQTSIGAEIGAALQGQRAYGPDVLQLLYIANRYEHAPRIRAWLAAGQMVVADRYAASSLAYGEAQGLDVAWLAETQRLLPAADLTVMLDIAPETSLSRKRAARDKFERDLPLLARVRESYRRQAQAPGWQLIDGTQPAEAVRADVTAAVRARLGLR